MNKEYIFAACAVQNFDSDMLKIRYFNNIESIKKWLKSFIDSNMSISDMLKNKMFDDTINTLNAKGKVNLQIGEMYLLNIAELNKIKKIKDR